MPFASHEQFFRTNFTSSCGCFLQISHYYMNSNALHSTQKSLLVCSFQTLLLILNYLSHTLTFMQLLAEIPVIPLHHSIALNTR